MPTSHEPLTARERQVLQLLRTHLRRRDIAARLHVSDDTVKTHVSAVYRKLRVTNRSEAVVRADELGLD